MKRLLFGSMLAAIVFVGCGSKPEFDPTANHVDTALLKPAQGHLAPGVMVYDVDGEKLGRVIKVDPDHIAPNGRRGGVLMDYEDPQTPDSYVNPAAFDYYFVPPSS